jgi:hypothetical protein
VPAGLLSPRRYLQTVSRILKFVCKLRPPKLAASLILPFSFVGFFVPRHARRAVNEVDISASTRPTSLPSSRPAYFANFAYDARSVSMSALGQKRTWPQGPAMSALPPLADQRRQAVTFSIDQRLMSICHQQRLSKPASRHVRSGHAAYAFSCGSSRRAASPASAENCARSAASSLD